MKNKEIVLPEYIKCAIESAIEASNIIISYYKKNFIIKNKFDNSPVTEADIASSNCIKKYLSKYNIPIIDEESKVIDYSIRKKWNRIWCVDPLDGTKEFIAQNDNFSVNIALIENNKSVFGIIANPVEKKIILGGLDFGIYEFSFLNFNKYEKWNEINYKNEIPSYWSVAISKSHQSENDFKLLEFLKNKVSLPIEIFKKGSALKFIDMIKNTTQLYPRFAPTMEWDTAAGQAILETINGKVLDFKSGRPLTYNKESLYNPNFIAFNPAFISEVGTFIFGENEIFI